LQWESRTLKPPLSRNPDSGMRPFHFSSKGSFHALAARRPVLSVLSAASLLLSLVQDLAYAGLAGVPPSTDYVMFPLTLNLEGHTMKCLPRNLARVRGPGKLYKIDSPLTRHNPPPPPLVLLVPPVCLVLGAGLSLRQECGALMWPIHLC